MLRYPITAPGPAGSDMLALMPRIRRDPAAFLELMWHRHGDVVQFPIPRPPHGRYELRPVPGRPVTATSSVTLRPAGGLPMLLCRRGPEISGPSDRR